MLHQKLQQQQQQQQPQPHTQDGGDRGRQASVHAATASHGAISARFWMNWDKPRKDTHDMSERMSRFSTNIIPFVTPSLTSFLPFRYHVCSSTSVNLFIEY
jgi:hypothetical protein